MARTGRPRSFDESEVLDGARDVFWQRGHGGASMRDVTDRVGVLPGSLYAAFGDKHALFVRALRRYAGDARAATAATLAQAPVLPRLRALLGDAVAAAQSAPGRGCMLGNTAVELLPGDADAARVVGDAYRDLERLIEDALRRGQATGEIRDDVDCGAQAHLLLTVMQGLHVVARAEPEPERLAAVVDAALAPLARD